MIWGYPHDLGNLQLMNTEAYVVCRTWTISKSTQRCPCLCDFFLLHLTITISSSFTVSIPNQEPSALWDVTPLWILRYYSLMNHTELIQPFTKSYITQVLRFFTCQNWLLSSFRLGALFELALALPSHFWDHNESRRKACSSFPTCLQRAIAGQVAESN